MHWEKNPKRHSLRYVSEHSQILTNCEAEEKNIFHGKLL